MPVLWLFCLHDGCATLADARIPIPTPLLHRELSNPCPVTLPELIAQTNMDAQSVTRLREELSKFTAWLGKHVVKYFVSEYETPGLDYIEKARSER